MNSFSSGSSLNGMMVAAASATILFLGACAKQNDSLPSDIRISAQIETRVTGLHFDAGDQIGLTIRLDGADHCANAPLAYNGTCFTGANLAWYAATEKSSEFRAYYPYRTDGITDRFILPADQSTGLAAADLLAACRSGIKPTSETVQMTFRHLMARVDISVTKAANTASIKQVRVGGGDFASQAAIDWGNLSATALPGAAAGTVTACCLTADAAYAAILVPQTNPLTVEIELADGKVLRQTRTVTLQSGYRYQMTVQVEAEKLTLTLSGAITDWMDGGSIGAEGAGDSGSSGGSGDDNPAQGDEPGQDPSNPTGDPSADEPGTLTYAGEQYKTQTIGGKVWMAEHLRYLPNGATIGNGVWKSSNGPELFYTWEAASGGVLNEGMRGICPQGWHIPTKADFEALITALGNEAAAFVGEAGFVNDEGIAYNNQTHYLLTSSKDGDNVFYLMRTNTEIKFSAKASKIGVPLRCVKD